MFTVCISLNLVYLVCIVISPCEGNGRFTIIRSSVDSRKADEFIVPRSKCSPSSLTCSTLYAGSTNHDPTQCKCACRFELSSFGYYSGRWICQDNSQVRKQQGCQFLFDGEHNYQPIRVLSTGPRYRIILPSLDCTIDQSASRYRKCDGTWAAISVQSNTFTFLPITENLGSGRYRYTMKVGSATSLAGRMVNLKVNCRNPSKSSCVLFKMAGEISCPVDIVRFTSTQTPSFSVTYPKITPSRASDEPTGNSSTEAPGSGKRASDSGDHGGSSGTVAAVVIVIILVIIVAAIVGFVIWKRKRGENILLMDYVISIATKFKSPPPTKKPDEPEEQIYAEIPEQPAQIQRATTYSAPAYAEISNYVFNHPNTAYTRPNQQNNQMPPPDEAPTDERGYMVPVDSPFHNDPQNSPHNNGKNTIPKTCSIREDRQTSAQGVGVGSNDVAPYYDVLDIPDARNTENHDKQIPVYNRQPDRNETGSSFVQPSQVPGTKGAADNNRYVAKQRRRPPSPPRKV